MKQLLSIISFVLLSASVFAQRITDNPTRVGYIEVRANGMMHIPLDTVLSPSANANFDQQIAKKNGSMYHYSISKGQWVKLLDGNFNAIDSARWSNDTLFLRQALGGEIAIKITGLPQSNIIGLPDSIQGNTWQRVTERGDTTNRMLSMYSYSMDALKLFQRSANMRIGFYNSSNALFMAMGDLGSSNKAEIAGYGFGLSLSSGNSSPVQIRTNDSLVINVDDTLVTVTTPLIAAPPTKDHHVAEKIYVDTTARNAVWRTLMTPLLTQPAIPIQPTDSLTQSLGKLQAQINNVNGSVYIPNQIAVDTPGNIRIKGQIQSSAGGLKINGAYSGGLSGAGIELGYNGSSGTLAPYNRTISAYLPFRLDGNPLLINTFSSGLVGIKNASPSFDLDLTGVMRIGGVNYKAFFDRTAVATQDNIIAWRSPGTTATDTIGYMGLASRGSNDLFISTLKANLEYRTRDTNNIKFSTHSTTGGQAKVYTIVKAGKWLIGDSLTSVSAYPLQIVSAQDTSIHVSHKVLSQGGFIGPVLSPIRTVTTTGTLLVTDNTLLVNNSGAVVQTLPTAASCPNLELTIKKVSAAANNVSIQPAGAELLDGTNTAKVLTLQWSAITVKSNGTSWFATSYYLSATTL